MFNPVQFFEAGKARSGTALIPIKNASTFAFYVSTRVGDYIVDKGDGSPPYLNVTLFPSKNIDFTSNFPTDNESIYTGGSLSYSLAFTGNVSLKFPHGLRDVYSLANNKPGNQGSKLNITDVETFFKQFPNLYSFYFNEFGSTAIIKGDLSRFPNSVERLYFNFTQVVNASIDLFLNLSNYDPASKLKYFNVFRTDSPLKILGDLGKTPSTLQFLNIQDVHAGSIITYTAGKVWASSFDTLYLPIPLGVFENDNLLNDLKNSVTTAIGGKVIYLGSGYRTSASDSAVTYLTGLGFTISGVTKLAFTPAKILDLPLQNNFTDYSASGISMVAGNANGFPSFVSDGSGGYALDFNGTKSIKTAINLPINTSDKVTIKFKIKTNQTTTGAVVELSPNFGLNNGFGVFINDLLANKIELLDATNSSNQNYVSSPTTINDNVWHSVKMVIDRALGIDQNKIYIDGVLSFTKYAPFYKDLNGNYGSYTLFIGQRNGSSLGLIAQLKELEIYNYPA